MNLENIVEDWMGSVSFFLRKPGSWLSLLGPTILHILGASFLQVLLTSSAVLFLSSFFFFFLFTVLIPNQENVSMASIQEDKDNLQEKELPILDESESSVNTEDSSEYMETTTTDDISDDDDGSISDEESLIELSLPSGHYLGNYGNDDNTIKGYSNKNKMYHKNIQDLRLFDQLLVEEDNLIEIDISIGSIKCSRFEIPA